MNLAQKLSSLAFFAVDKISNIFSRTLSTNIKTYNAWQQQSFIQIESNLQSKTVSLLKYSWTVVTNKPYLKGNLSTVYFIVFCKYRFLYVTIFLYIMIFIYNYYYIYMIIFV